MMNETSLATRDVEDLYSEAAAVVNVKVDLGHLWLNDADNPLSSHEEGAVLLRACTVLESASVRAIGLQVGADVNADALTDDACLAVADVIKLCWTQVGDPALRRALRLDEELDDQMDSRGLSPRDRLRRAHRFATIALRHKAWTALRHVGGSEGAFTALRDRIEQAAAMHLAGERYDCGGTTVREVLASYQRRLEQWLNAYQISSTPGADTQKDLSRELKPLV